MPPLINEYHIRLLFAKALYWFSVSKWCTVTVTDPSGRRHSLDVLAGSTYDAAHLFVVEAKQERESALPKPTLATVFEVVVQALPGTDGEFVSIRKSSRGAGWAVGRRANR